MSIHPQSLAKVISFNVRCSTLTLITYIAPPFPHPGAPQPAVIGKPKRKQVKMAVCVRSRPLYSRLLSGFTRVQCTNCASACKKCDDGRPCQRCMRSNLASTCKDGVRKERKRGIKRGPYKRRNKPPSDDEAEVPRGRLHYPNGLSPADLNLLQNQHPRHHLLFLKAISHISCLHLAIFKAQMVRTVPRLQSRFPFTRITSWRPSPTLLGSLCLSCNRFPVSQAHPITPSNRLDHRAREGRGKGAPLMNCPLRRKQSPMINKQTVHLMLRQAIPARL